MKTLVLYKDEFESLCDTLILPFYEGIEFQNIDLILNDDLESTISYLVREELFIGKFNQVESFRTLKEENPKNIILIGLGKEDNLNLERIRVCMSKAIKRAKEFKSRSVQIHPFGMSCNISYFDSCRAMVESAIMTDYKFDRYKSKSKDDKTIDIEELNILHPSSKKTEKVEEGAIEGKILGLATNYARDLVNEPSNNLTPKDLANKALELGKESGFEVEILEYEQIKALKMDAYLEVSKSATNANNKPRLIVAKYMNNKESDEILGLVGKGLTYDSGGLSLKSTASMLTMKSDMGGSASVLGAFKAISEAKLKANVIGVIAACENSISAHAYRPGDVINSMAKKTIEVMNTDAEGRLTLADALYYIINEHKVNKVIDVATLTGSAVSALGSFVAASMTNDDEFYKYLNKATDLSGEKVHKLPMYDHYKEQIKSNIADIKNTGGKEAGAITAGFFLKEFVGDTPWIHIDIAGPSYLDKDKDYLKKGGTGFLVRTLYHFVNEYNKQI